MKIINEDRKTKKKVLRLLCFLLSGLLVMTASAAVYYSLSTQPRVTITAPVVAFTQGGDWSKVAGAIGENGTWCSLVLKAYPNATMTYGEPLNLTNLGANVTIKLRSVSISPVSGNADVGNFTFINFTLHDQGGAIKGSLNYTTNGNDWSTPSMDPVTMYAYDKWYFTIQTRAVGGAQANIEADIVIAVDVQE